jgi:CxxC-x17-CxxC domain-containing protein
MPKFNRDSRGGGFSGGFNNRGGGFGGRDGGRPSFGGKPRFGGGDRGPVVMNDATCDECKRPCQVPFRPTGDRPIYCKNCFDKRGGGREMGRTAGAAGNISPDGFSVNDIKTQLAMINIKLDKLLKKDGVPVAVASKKEEKPAVASESYGEVKEEVAEVAPKVVKSKKVSKK